MTRFPAPSEGILLTHFVVSAEVERSRAVSANWGARGAEFLTPPVDHGRELRCFLRDPDGHLIEVGQFTGMLDAA